MYAQLSMSTVYMRVCMRMHACVCVIMYVCSALVGAAHLAMVVSECVWYMIICANPPHCALMHNLVYNYVWLPCDYLRVYAIV